MNKTAKFLYCVFGGLILVVLLFLRADQYFRSGFYNRYMGIMLALSLTLWLVACVVIWKWISPLSKGKALIRWLAVFTGACLIIDIVEYFLLNQILLGASAQIRFSFVGLILFWLMGILFFLGWHIVYSLVKALFTDTHSTVLKVFRIILLSLVGLSVLLILGTNLCITIMTRSQIYTNETVPNGEVAIVFGAGVWEEQYSPTLVLKDRIDAVVDLYQAGKTERILLSGDGMEGSLEVEIMKRYALEQGIPEGALLLDPLGDRSFNTCQQAKETFGVEEAILVTQRYHLPRALFTCDGLGIQSAGLIADQRTYSPVSQAVWGLREMLATAYGWVEVFFVGK